MEKFLRARRTGIVTKVIHSKLPSQPEIAEISIEDADPLYREIRIANSFEGDGTGNARLTEGTRVQVTIEAKLSESALRYGN